MSDDVAASLWARIRAGELKDGAKLAHLAGGSTEVTSALWCARPCNSCTAVDINDSLDSQSILFQYLRHRGAGRGTRGPVTVAVSAAPGTRSLRF